MNSYPMSPSCLFVWLYCFPVCCSLIVSKTKVEETGPQTLVVGLALLLTSDLAQKEEYVSMCPTPLSLSSTSFDYSDTQCILRTYL